MRIILLACFLCTFCGCSLIEKYQQTKRERAERRAEREAEFEARAEEFEKLQDRQFDGWSEDKVIENFGAPSRIETAGSYKIYYYTTDNGVVSRSSGFVIGNSAFGDSKSRRNFEETTFFFKNGKVTKWDYDRQ